MSKKFSKPNLSRQINGDLPVDETHHQHLADSLSATSALNSAQNQNPNSDLHRLDRALADLYPEYSRASLQKFIKNGQVSVNHEIITIPKTLINPLIDQLELKVDESVLATRPPIIYEDDNVLVVNKPTGLLSVCKGDATPEPSLEDLGLIVHRLDRDTSGVIILAKNPDTASLLQKQFQQRKTKKTYYAIVFGCPTQQHAIINIPLARNLKAPTTFMPDPNGREAITEYRVLETIAIPASTSSNSSQPQTFSLLELKPKTGRTHQLRIHLAHLGTPILGDPVYGNQKLEALFPADRMFLHASSLEITIPTSNRQTFTAPFPDDFKTPLKSQPALHFTLQACPGQESSA